METAALLAIISGATSILQVSIPALQKMFSSGEITPEQQAEVKKKFDELRSDLAFTGPEWEA